MANNLKSLRVAAGLTQDQLAERMGTTRNQLTKLEGGSRRLADNWIARAAKALELDPGALVSDAAPGTAVRLDGLIGAGGEIDTNVSQAYAGDVAEIQVDIPLPPGIAAYEVWGNSMLPKYDPGDVILVREAAIPVDQVLGDVALAVTRDYRRFLKRVLRGSEDHLYDLESFNAPTMKDVELSQVGAIHLVVPAKQVRRPIGEKEIARRIKRPGRPKKGSVRDGARP